MQEFLMQEMRQSHDYQESIGHLFQLVNGAN